MLPATVVTVKVLGYQYQSQAGETEARQAQFTALIPTSAFVLQVLTSCRAFLLSARIPTKVSRVKFSS